MTDQRPLPAGFTYSDDGKTVYRREEGGHTAWSTTLFWRMRDDFQHIADVYAESERRRIENLSGQRND